MIPGIGAWLLGLVLPAQVARKFALPGFVLACVLLIVAGWGAWQVFDWFNDRAAVAEDRAAHNARVNEDLRRAEGQAGRAKAERDRAEAEQQDELEDTIDDHEDAGSSPADDVWGSVFDPAR